MTTTRTARPTSPRIAALAYPTYEDQLMDELDLMDDLLDADAAYARRGFVSVTA